MRVKTEARRQAILDAAAQVFREQGFEGATMSAICERVGGSKATLYGYFESKEELFVAVAMRSILSGADQIVGSLKDGGDLRAELEEAGRAFLRIRLSPAPLAIQRVILGQNRPDLGRMFYEQGPFARWRRAAEFLEKQMDEGRLRRADPWTAACQLKALFEADLVDRATFAVETEFSEDRIRRAAKAAVDSFLRAYAPEKETA